MNNIIKQLAEYFVNGEQPLPYFPGLYQGKAGIAVFLCHYSSYSNDNSYCDYAFELIQTSHRQLMDKNPVNYSL
ncbi:hypothetical protein [uncultured Proteiniphilum sp.]|uniref:hypothetical protein n=1 Tax=uncultured Proteiniphilum sp. TaxID=497637 RepID=UPI002607975F|nr:hypothetical protein [uncultured Proteiniphilum sp.]